MDWFDITLWGFAIVGVIFVILVIVVGLSEAFGGSIPEWAEHDHNLAAEAAEDRLQQRYWDMHLQMKHSIMEGKPTLLGRVEAIEKHLGVEVYVKPAVDEKLAVRKRK